MRDADFLEFLQWALSARVSFSRLVIFLTVLAGC